MFNQHVANDMNFRVVEALACRRLLLTDGQRNGQYELFRDREHLVYYKDDDDLEALLLHFLRAEGERERIAAAGHELVHRLHTTAARVRTIVATAENLLRARGGPPRRTIATEIVHAVSSPPALRALVLAGELDREPDQLDRLSTVLRALAGPGVQADVLALAPPEEHVRDARLHLAAGPRLPALDTAPRAGALLQNVPLLAGARRLLEQGDCTPDVVVATRQEHARTARALGRPFSVVVDSVPTSAEDVQILERASALLTLSPELQVTLSGRLPALAARLLCLCDPEHGAKVASLLRAHVHTRCSGGDSAEGRPAPPLSTLRAADVLYDHEYMRRNRYSVRSPEEARLKAVQAGLIRRVLSPRRALVAGCAAGELLLPLLAGGVDAWGFDAARDLEAFVYPEVRGRVVAFDVARIHQFPFATTGGSFDTFVAIDLFEHIDEERVDSMLDGIAAHFERLALVISSSPAFEGHVCVKPFPWWLAKLEARGFELLAEPSVLEPHETGTYGVRRFAGVHEDMSEQLVFLRRRSRRDGAAAAAEAAAARAQPDVSVMLVCCDRPQPLEVTIESTRCSLVGSKTSTEWLAFDNGSSAPVRRLLDEGGFDTVLRSRENRGLAPALDALFREARGRYLLTLEDDWRCLAEGPEWLELAVAVLESQPDVGVVRLRRRDDGQCGHFRHHRPEVALRHHPWSVVPLPDVVETRIVNGQQVYVAAAEWVNWTHNPTLCRREVREWLGSLSALLLDPRDHRPRAGHPGLEGAIDVRWRAGPWKVAKLLDGPFTHIGDLSAGVGAS
ncbi:MAG: glycosyltransferase [Planctomycetes bacterium]|nr:glycosyltransferase [Planctomycetota bacterium]